MLNLSADDKSPTYAVCPRKQIVNQKRLSRLSHQIDSNRIGSYEINSATRLEDFTVKKLKCFFCSKLLYNQRGLKQHCLQKHSNAMGYAFKCKSCTHKFREKKELDQHIKDYHT